MLELIVVLLIVLWVFGFINVNGVTIPNWELFSINGHLITLWNLLTFALIVWAIGILPRPFREIGSVLLILWVLSIFGILTITGLSNIILIAVIVGLIFYLVGGSRAYHTP